MTEHRRPRRPSYLEPAALEAVGGRHDPIAGLQAAHETAAVLVHRGRAATDPETIERLVRLVDEIGLPDLAELWAARPARSLPGALWRLYLLREWMTRHPEAVAREYAAGVRFTEPNHVVAGVDPPGPDEVRQVADQILRGAFTGDFAVALERAAAFCAPGGAPPLSPPAPPPAAPPPPPPGPPPPGPPASATSPTTSPQPPPSGAPASWCDCPVARAPLSRPWCVRVSF